MQLFIHELMNLLPYLCWSIVKAIRFHLQRTAIVKIFISVLMSGKDDKTTKDEIESCKEWYEIN